MIRFDTDDTLAGARPDGLPDSVWDTARDIAEENVHDSFVTFFVAEGADDLADGGPISEPVCCGGGLAAAIADAPLTAERRDFPGGAVWAAPVNACGYRVDAVLIPEESWVPADVLAALRGAAREPDNH